METFKRTSAARLLAFFFSVGLLSPCLWALTPTEERTSVDERRIEEEKREDLKPTQEITTEKPKPRDPKEQTFDRLDLAYMMAIMQKKFTHRYDACKAIVLILGVQDQYLDMNAQVAFLREKEILPKKFEKEFDVMQPLRKGLFAYMVAKTLDIKGGVSMRLFGMKERTAVKELAFEGIMPDSNKNDLVRGDEFVIVLQEASKYFKKMGPGKVGL